jgi:hypothetical protein
MSAESSAETTGVLPVDEPTLREQAGPGSQANDLAAKATAKVDEMVSLLRDKTVNPVSTAVRYLIFGLLAFGVLGLLAVLFAVFGLRLLDNEVPVFTHRVWASYLVLAGIFWLTGAFLSHKRHPRK